MIKKVPVETYAEIRICDRCRVGEMNPTGDNMLLCDPPKFEHSCSICGTKDYYTEKYPNIVHAFVFTKED